MGTDSENSHRPRNFDWYSKLNKSKITPPPWVFPVVWTILYICILISGGIYLRETGLQWSVGLGIYIVQWALNLVWSPLFFWKKMIKTAMIDITLLWICIVLNIVYFQEVSPLSSYFLYPYIAWICVAWYLNFYIVMNNKIEEGKVKDGN